MPDSEQVEEQAPDEGTLQAVNQLAQEVREYLGDGNPMLAGPCMVTLTWSFQTPTTPILASEMAMMEVAKIGLNSFVFEVLDVTTGDKYYVRAGKVYTEAELEEEWREFVTERDGVEPD